MQECDQVSPEKTKIKMNIYAVIKNPRLWDSRTMTKNIYGPLVIFLFDFKKQQFSSYSPKYYVTDKGRIVFPGNDHGFKPEILNQFILSQKDSIATMVVKKSEEATSLNFFLHRVTRLNKRTILSK